MNQATILNRLSVIEQSLKANPNMWHGAKSGYKAEHTRLTKALFKLNGNICPSCSGYKRWGGQLECSKCR